MRTGLKLALVFLVLSLCLLFVSLSQPWYQVSEGVEYDPDGPHNEGILPGTGSEDAEEEKISYYFDRIDVSMRGREGSVTHSNISIEYDSDPATRSEYSHIQSTEQTSSHMRVTNFLVYASFGGTILALVAGVLTATGKIKKETGAALAVIGFSISLLLPVYFAVGINEAIDEDGLYPTDADEGPHESFIGLEEKEVFTFEKTTIWRPATGWFLAVGAAVMNLGAIAGIVGAGETSVKDSKYINNGYIDRLKRKVNGEKRRGENNTQNPPPPRDSQYDRRGNKQQRYQPIDDSTSSHKDWADNVEGVHSDRLPLDSYM